MSEWKFITNHGLILLAISKDLDEEGEGKTTRQIGDEVGVTERTAHKIILDLEDDGYINKYKVGTKNTYKIRPERQLKATSTEVGKLLELLSEN